MKCILTFSCRFVDLFYVVKAYFPILLNQSEKMVVCKLSSVSSQQEFVERLTEFRNEDCKEVMIIVSFIYCF